MPMSADYRSFIGRVRISEKVSSATKQTTKQKQKKTNKQTIVCSIGSSSFMNFFTDHLTLDVSQLYVEIKKKSIQTSMC